MSPFTLISQDPLSFYLLIMAIIYGITVHEFSHALAAYSLGDSTAQRLGRLTLNPLSHIDFLGLLMLILAGFGWGKPVPFDPKQIKHERLGSVIISMAGPLSNFLSAVVFSFLAGLYVVGTGATQDNLLLQFFLTLIFINVGLGVFNLLPIPPLDGSKLLLAILPDQPFLGFKIFLQEKGPFLLLLMLALDRVAGINIFGFLFDFIWTVASKLI